MLFAALFFSGFILSPSSWQGITIPPQYKCPSDVLFMSFKFLHNETELVRIRRGLKPPLMCPGTASPRCTHHRASLWLRFFLGSYIQAFFLQT